MLPTKIGATGCAKCEFPFSTVGEGNSVCNACERGYFMWGETCRLCSEGVVCDTPLVTLANMQTEEGWWRYSTESAVVLECGIGGFLDATNIVTAEELICSTIVSIGYDHMDVLGDTLEEIASEKSGVIKQGAPCVVGPTAW